MDTHAVPAGLKVQWFFITEAGRAALGACK
jgi:hypothetical protein